MEKKDFPYTFFQGKFVRTEQANVSVMTNALQYGTGVFAGIRGYYNKEKQFLSIFRLSDHYRRFLSSLKVIGVETKYSQEKLEKITLELVRKNVPNTDVYIRPFAYASSLNIAPNLTQDQVFDFSLYMIRLGEYLPTDKGLSVMVSSWRRIADNAIPARAKISGAYINSALARKEADEKGFNEAILLTEDGHVSEGSAENLFLVRDGVLVTAPPTDDILEGITRKTIIQFAKDLKIPVEERRVDRTELYVCDEAFFSGTGVQVSWIAHIDHRQVGTGRRGLVTKRLQDLFFEVVKGNNKMYSDWCTIVTV